MRVKSCLSNDEAFLFVYNVILVYENIDRRVNIINLWMVNSVFRSRLQLFYENVISFWIIACINTKIFCASINCNLLHVHQSRVLSGIKKNKINTKTVGLGWGQSNTKRILFRFKKDKRKMNE